MRDINQKDMINMHYDNIRINEYNLPMKKSGLYGSIVGSDGAVWSAENTGNTMGRISTKGEVKGHTVPTPDSGLSKIANGADGDLWFTEYKENKIEKFQ
jgi:virginiamycin B lyase